MFFFSDPFLYSQYEKDNKKQYKHIEVGEYLRKNRKQMQGAVSFVEEKYKKYIPILTDLLNEIHNTNYSEVFWKKCLSFAFYRYLTVFHDMFTRCKAYFNPSVHDCQILSEKSYYIPYDFEDHFDYFVTNSIGQEQIFSLFINYFFPDCYSSIELKNENIFFKKNKSSVCFKKLLIKNIEKIFSYRQRKIKVGILDSYFSSENILELTKKSSERIQLINVFRFKRDVNKNTIDWKKRNIFTEFKKDFDDFDDFDNYFFYSLKYCLPKAFIENFEKIFKSNLKIFKKRYTNLKYIVSEAWQSDTYDSMALAIAKEEKDIKHIYNEHNGFSHCFMGNIAYQKADLVDYFVTVGWFDETIPKIVKGASLFPFIIEKPVEKKYQALLVTNATEARMYHYGGWYATMEINAVKNLEYDLLFFKNLKKDSLRKISYRGHPIEYTSKRMTYNKEEYLKEYLKDVTTLPATYNEGETCKEQMIKSRLVIVDNPSTTYLESLHMNIPTVFFLNLEASYLDEKYKDFYKPLINAGICQTDPVNAAKFIESILDNPEIWWDNYFVQKCKNKWLNNNFQNSQVMIDYLIKLADE